MDAKTTIEKMSDSNRADLRKALAGDGNPDTIATLWGMSHANVTALKVALEASDGPAIQEAAELETVQHGTREEFETLKRHKLARNNNFDERNQEINNMSSAEWHKDSKRFMKPAGIKQIKDTDAMPANAGGSA